MIEPLKNGLTATAAMTAEELAEVRQLARVCNEQEEIVLKLNWDILGARARKGMTGSNDFLFYEDGELIGFLAIYCFNKEEAELSGMVHPAHRRQGIFTRLLTAAKAELVRRAVPRLIFILSGGSASGLAFIEAQQGAYAWSEHRMVLEADAVPALPDKDEPVLLERATTAKQDIEDLSRMSALAFNMPGTASQEMTEKQLGDTAQRQYFGVKAGERVGKIGLVLTPNEQHGLIIGFCVLPELQGKGYGREILARTMHLLLAEGFRNMELEVAVENAGALGLYESCGFRRVSTYDYYEISLADAQ